MAHAFHLFTEDWQRSAPLTALGAIIGFLLFAPVAVQSEFGLTGWYINSFGSENVTYNQAHAYEVSALCIAGFTTVVVFVGLALTSAFGGDRSAAD